MYCDFFDQHPELMTWADLLEKIPADYKNCYSTLGSAVIAGYGYSLPRIRPAYENRIQAGNIMAAVLNMFLPGSTYIKEDIKPRLQAVYNGLGLARTAKATDLFEYFILAETVQTSCGVRKKAFIILDYNEGTIHAIQEHMGNRAG